MRIASANCRDWIYLDDAIFCRFLAISSLCLHARSEPSCQPSVEAIHYQTKAFVSINQRLCNPSRRTEDSVVASVLTFAAQGISRMPQAAWCWESHFSLVKTTPRVDEWQVHLSGLKLILDLRGGADSITAQPALRMTLFL
jgi:hypothetical protein